MRSVSGSSVANPTTGRGHHCALLSRSAGRPQVAGDGVWWCCVCDYYKCILASGGVSSVGGHCGVCISVKPASSYKNNWPGMGLDTAIHDAPREECV